MTDRDELLRDGVPDEKPPPEPTAELPEEPSCINRIRAANKRDKILDEHLQYTDALRAAAEELQRRLFSLTQSILDLTHPNIKMLAKQRDKALQRAERAERRWDGEGAEPSTGQSPNSLIRKPEQPTDAAPSTASAGQPSASEKGVTDER